MSCMDCGKDFWGEQYASHVKCISEDQKYGGSNYVSKEHKGEKKQEEWVIRTKEKVANTQNMNPQLRGLLQNILCYDNIPRKEAKFKNFMRNVCRSCSPKLVNEAWEVFKDANSEKHITNTDSTKNGVTEVVDSDKKNNGENIQETHNELDINCTNGIAKLSKRERKELRREKQSKKSKKDKHVSHDNDKKSGTKRKFNNEEAEPNLETTVPKKKKKKRKGDDSLVEEEQDKETVKPKKKKKKKGDYLQEESFLTANENHVMQEENEEQAQPQPVSAFKWTVAIKRVLQDAPEEGLKVSKLQRKVFALYCAAHGEDAKSKAELIPILHKKLNKKNHFVVFKDKVKLRKL